MRALTTPPSDRELVEAVRQGDMAAFDTLYRRHVPRVRAAVAGSVRSQDLLDEVVQDAFVRGLERLDTLRDPDRFVPWLTSIARNAATDHHRERRSEPLDDELAETASAKDVDPEERAELRELGDMVRGTLAALSPRDAHALSLVAYLGFSPRDVATALGVSHNAAKVILHRARNRMRKALALELLVRRQAATCDELEALAMSDDPLAAVRHIEVCEVCTSAASSELALYDAALGSLRDDELPTVIFAPGTRDERSVVVDERLFVGRECSGISDRQRLIVDRPDVSRHHLEIRLDLDRGRAEVVDMSANGTRLNGARLERAVPRSLRSGDRLQLGDVELEFRGSGFRDSGQLDLRQTIRQISSTRVVMVVGDIIGYSTISQSTDNETIATALETVFSELRVLLRLQQGTLSNYAGDAFLAVWELDQLPDAVEHALDFVVAAAQRIDQLAPELALRTAGGDPIQMGWAVVVGDAAVSALTGVLVTLLGDAVNVAFRLSSLAGRDGRARILVSEAVRDIAGEQVGFGAARDTLVKGRLGRETTYGLSELTVSSPGAPR